MGNSLLLYVPHNGPVLKLMNHELAMWGNPTPFHRAKPIEKISRKDHYKAFW